MSQVACSYLQNCKFEPLGSNLQYKNMRKYLGVGGDKKTPTRPPLPLVFTPFKKQKTSRHFMFSLGNTVWNKHKGFVVWEKHLNQTFKTAIIMTAFLFYS